MVIYAIVIKISRLLSDPLDEVCFHSNNFAHCALIPIHFNECDWDCYFTKILFYLKDLPFDDGTAPPEEVVGEWFNLLRQRFTDDPTGCIGSPLRRRPWQVHSMHLAA